MSFTCMEASQGGYEKNSGEKMFIPSHQNSKGNNCPSLVGTLGTLGTLGRIVEEPKDFTNANYVVRCDTCGEEFSVKLM